MYSTEMSIKVLLIHNILYPIHISRGSCINSVFPSLAAPVAEAGNALPTPEKCDYFSVNQNKIACDFQYLSTSCARVRLQMVVKTFLLRNIGLKKAII